MKIVANYVFIQYVAWFAANTTVTATGMSVTAKSDNTFLLIKAGALEGETSAKVSAIQTDKAISATATNTSGVLYPCAHDSVANITAADTVSNWYYKTSDDPSLYGGQGHESAPTQLSSFTDYVLVNEFNMTIAQGGNQMDNLRVGTCTITTSGSQAVGVLVASATAVEEFSGTGGALNRADPVILQSSLTSTTLMQVKVYIYWDGTDSDVTTNNFDNLLSTTVELTFTGSVHVA